MNEGLFRKGLVLVIIVCFIGTSIAPCIDGNISKLSSVEEVDSFVFSESNSGAILDVIYVNDDADPSWYDATHVKTIQEGVNNASIGDTIQVYSGIYNESININKKNVKLEGINHEHDSSEDIGMPIIDALGNDNVIDISAGGTTISGFIIRNSGKNEGDCGIEIHTNENLILGNIIIENNVGIISSNCNNNVIEDNTITNNIFNGISLDTSIDITISKNKICNNNIGIYLENSNGNNVTSGNNISNNVAEGIYIYSSSGNTISGNTVSNNNNGIYLYSSSGNKVISGNNILNNNEGIYIYSSSGNTILGNNISYNQDGIYFHSSNDNKFISGNNISNNVAEGIYIYSSSDNTISGNTINNNFNGINLDESSDNNVISGNNILNNNMEGIILFYSSVNTIEGNTISLNNGPGIKLSANSDNNVISGNNISLNNDCGIYLDWSHVNTIEGNTISLNYVHGVILSWSSDNNDISGNNISNNRRGITLDESSNNVISGNKISLNNEYGIELCYSDNNTILLNIIKLNHWYGIHIAYYSNNNLLYYNNLEDNWYNAYDEGNNFWDNESLEAGKFGNYWSDYKENYPDSTNDGYVWHTPYNISGGSNQDRYPLVNPMKPPYKPDKPTGPTSGKPGKEYTYSTITTDPNNDQIRYWFRWGDEDGPWTNYYKSGETASASHKWDEEGTYIIQVIAEDKNGQQSDWSDPLSVSIPKSKPYINTPFLNFLQNFLENHPLIYQLLQRFFKL